MDLKPQVSELVGAVAADLDGDRHGWQGSVVTAVGAHMSGPAKSESLGLPLSEPMVQAAATDESATEGVAAEPLIERQAAAAPTSLDVLTVQAFDELVDKAQPKSGSKQKRRPGVRSK